MCAAWENKQSLVKIDPAGGIWACLIATTLATVTLYAGWFFSGPWVDVMKLFGSFFVGNETGAYWIGGLLVLSVGLVSTGAYLLTWKSGLLRPGIHTAAIMGLGHGLIAVAALQILYALVPHPPVIYMTLGKTFVTLVAHLVFGLSTAVVYRPFFTAR